jgi:hypothetical protein
MSGDWIKIEITTPDKPEVVAMATHLRVDQDAVVGKLLRLWGWANLNSENGEALPITEAFVDRLTNQRRFASALRHVGWLTGTDGALCFVNFDRHNGSSAKARAIANRKKSGQRARNSGTNVPEAVGQMSPNVSPITGGQNRDERGGPEIEEEIEIQSSARPIPPPPAAKGEFSSASPSSPKPSGTFGSGLDALLVAALRRAEGTESAPLTPAARRELEHAAREILTASPVATSATIAAAAAAYRRAFPTATLTAHALAKHWPRLQPAATTFRPIASVEAEPAGWRDWIAENCPDSPFAPGGEKSGLAWPDLDPDHRRHLIRELAKLAKRTARAAA